MTYDEIKNQVDQFLSQPDRGDEEAVEQALVKMMCEAAGIEFEAAAADAGFKDWWKNWGSPRTTQVRRDCQAAWWARGCWEYERRNKARRAGLLTR